MRKETRHAKLIQAKGIRAAEVADRIEARLLNELAAAGGDANSLNDWKEVVERLGACYFEFTLPLSAERSRKTPGMFFQRQVEGKIYQVVGINETIPASFKVWVIIHELAHLLHTRIEPREWIVRGTENSSLYLESVARAVERNFMESGQMKAGLLAEYISRY
jgi:Zn-dependent peptidase ImmA (M78 family)